MAAAVAMGFWNIWSHWEKTRFEVIPGFPQCGQGRRTVLRQSTPFWAPCRTSHPTPVHAALGTVPSVTSAALLLRNVKQRLLNCFNI